MTKVLILGLDGATFTILRPLARQGRLPNLARLLQEGASGGLKSSVPPVTPAAWTSFFTGKNPGKHGIFDFQSLNYHDYSFQTVRTDLHAEKTLWQLVGEAGLRSIVWDVPFTYPPQPLLNDGWMLTGYGTPRVPGTVFTFPHDLTDRIPPELQPEMRVALPKVRFDRSTAFIEEFKQIMDGRRKLLTWLVREQAWDLFMVVFSITDTMAHVFWTYVDPNHPNYLHPEAETYREAFFNAYEQCDALIGELLETAGSDTAVIVISDHGFGSVRPRQYIYRRLMQGGYVQPKSSGRTSPLGRLAKTATDLYIRFPFLREWVKGLGASRRKALMTGLKSAGVVPTAENIDFGASSVIPTNFGLRMWVHDDERFPRGIVPAAQVEDVAAALETYLLADKDPKNGKQIIRRVHRGPAIYTGPFAAEGPDIVIEYENHFEFDAPVRADNPFTEGGHTPEGILLMQGPGLRHTEISAAGLMDMAPTVLHLLGLPVPPDMDGQVLAEAFDPAALEAQPVRMGTEPAVNEDRRAGKGYSEEEEAEVLEQLRKLGYI